VSKWLRPPVSNSHTATLTSSSGTGGSSFGTNVSHLSGFLAHNVRSDTSVCNVSQVYGGAISVMVGPHVWSFVGFGDSSASSGDTSCDNCSVVVTGTSITSSRASSQSSGNADAAPTVVFFSSGACEKIYDLLCQCMLPSSALMPCAGDSNGAFVRADFCGMRNSMCLTAEPQVYGGGVAFIVHPYVWSSSSFFGSSSSSAGSTIVSRLSANFSNCSFSGCAAWTRTISGSTSHSFNCNRATFTFMLTPTFNRRRWQCASCSVWL
jgi:hypothetical protein